jgi:hypothetical protein
MNDHGKHSDSESGLIKVHLISHFLLENSDFLSILIFVLIISSRLQAHKLMLAFFAIFYLYIFAEALKLELMMFKIERFKKRKAKNLLINILQC